jgi:hypothetical protein
VAGVDAAQLSNRADAERSVTGFVGEVVSDLSDCVQVIVEFLPDESECIGNADSSRERGQRAIAVHPKNPVGRMRDALRA